MLCVQWKRFAARTRDVDIAQEQTNAAAPLPVDMDVRETLIRVGKGVLPTLDSRQPSIRFSLLYSIAIYKQITYTASRLHRMSSGGV